MDWLEINENIDFYKALGYSRAFRKSPGNIVYYVIFYQEHEIFSIDRDIAFGKYIQYHDGRAYDNVEPFKDIELLAIEIFKQHQRQLKISSILDI